MFLTNNTEEETPTNKDGDEDCEGNEQCEGRQFY